jgi:hypothetical protein
MNLFVLCEVVATSLPDIKIRVGRRKPGLYKSDIRNESKFILVVLIIALLCLANTLIQPYRSIYNNYKVEGETVNLRITNECRLGTDI